MVAGDPDQASFGDCHGGRQRHPDLGSDSRHPPRHCKVEEEPEFRGAGNSAAAGGRLTPDQFWPVHPDPACDFFRPRLLMSPESTSPEVALPMSGDVDSANQYSPFISERAVFFT